MVFKGGATSVIHYLTTSPPPKYPQRTHLYCFLEIYGVRFRSVLLYSVGNVLHVVISYSKYSKSVQNVVLHYIFSSESLRVVNSLQIVHSLRVLFLVCRGPLGWALSKG